MSDESDVVVERQFYAIIHMRPANIRTGEPTRLGKRTYLTLDVAPHQAVVPLPVTFDQVKQRLDQLPQMFLEPDGAFVWVGSSPDPWQVDGLLVDDGQHLLHAEVKGTCPEDRLEDLMTPLGWPDTELMFQIVRAGVFLSDEEFRRAVYDPEGLR